MAKREQIRIDPDQKDAFAEIARAVLKFALLGLQVAVLLTSPTGFSGLIPELTKLGRKHGDKLVDKSLEKIVKDRFIKIVEKSGKTTVKITQKGKVRLINFDIDTIKIKDQEWDGKWRFVIFDIPEKLRVARDVLRSKLKEIGFMQIQKSVWASPYECEDEINFISSVYQVEKYVNYIVASQIDHEGYLRSKFNI